MTVHGHFHWNELVTTDPERAKKFYGETIGWTFQGMPMEDGGTYWVAFSNSEPAAGIFPMQGAPDHWMPFLAVDDIDTRVRKAIAAGAKLMRPIFDVPNVGRLAILTEPGGAGVGWMTPSD